MLLDTAADRILGDANRLQQVVWNLLSNAVKFTPTGGRVQITLQRTGSHARITVSDTGSGIPSEFVSHVFEPFRQADGSITRGQAGLGLGLAIARRLVEMHGGNISAASEGEGRGASFTVTIPIVAVPTTSASPTGSAAATMSESEAIDAELPNLS